MATVWMLYEQRVIQNGREYYDESRQTVSLRRDADEKRTVEVMGADDVSPAVWSIKIVPHDEQGNEQPEFLSGHLNDGAPPRELVFTDYGLASKAVHWFRTQSDGVSGKTVFNYPGNWERANADKKRSMIPVKRTLNECDPKYDPKYRLSGYAPLPKGE